MLPDRVSNPGPLTYESGVLPIALRGPADQGHTGMRHEHCFGLIILGHTQAFLFNKTVQMHGTVWVFAVFRNTEKSK